MTKDRKPPRAMLALIALATDLPVPKMTIFYRDNGLLSLNFERVDDAIAWAAFLGGSLTPYARAGKRYAGQYEQITWHGWHVNVDAVEPATTPEPADVLTGDDRDALEAIAQGEGCN